MDYYSEVVGKLLKYKEYKQRVKKLLDIIHNKAEISAYQYSHTNSSSNGIFDSTFEAAIDRLEGEEKQEFDRKFEIVNDIELGLASLTRAELFIIKEKYIDNHKPKDAYIYTDDQFRFGKTKYYELKDKAVKKIAKVWGIYEKNQKRTSGERMANTLD